MSLFSGPSSISGSINDNPMNPMDPSNPHSPWIPIGSQSSLLGAESDSDERSEEEISEGVDRPLEVEHE